MTTLGSDSTLSVLPTSTHLSVVHHLVTIKLTRDNYLLWKAQIVSYLCGQHLFGFLDSSRPAPLQTLIVTAVYLNASTQSRLSSLACSRSDDT